MINSKFSLLFVIICSSQVASQSCKFKLFESYTCKLTITNADESTQLTGQHLQGKGDRDVETIATRNTGSTMRKIPSTLCQKFPNLEKIDLSAMRLEEITENSLKNCKMLDNLDMSVNKLRRLPKNAFASQSKLFILNLNQNQLTDLEQTSFANLRNLWTLWLDDNQIETLPDGIFSPLTSLEFLHMNRD